MLIDNEKYQSIKETRYDIDDEVRECSDGDTYHQMKMETLYLYSFGSARIVVIPLFESMKEITGVNYAT